MDKQHTYQTILRWTGNKGTGTNSYSSYERSHTIHAENKPMLEGSADPAFRGDNTKYNPEELLLAALSACHMLWYLHLCSAAGVIVLSYTDHATARMIETADGSGRFAEATLNPTVGVAAQSMIAKAETLHTQANAMCFIANSVNFPVHHQPTTCTATMV